MSIQSINPVNGATIKSYQEDSTDLVVQKIKETHLAWTKWRETPFADRAKGLVSLANNLRKRKDKLANLMAQEMGKPIKDGLAEVEKCATVCEYYAENGKQFLEDKTVITDASKSYVTFQPIGIVLAIMPWNFPFWQVFRFLAPSLIAGNCGLLKHASNVPGCALAIENLIKESEFPPHVFQTLMIGSRAVEAVIANPLVKAVTLTGSTNAGMKVAELCGKFLKKSVLELGGSDPYIILEDADLELAAEVCANSRLINNGQSCVAAKRFIVLKEIEKEFTKLFIEKVKQKTTGDPLSASTDLGPMARLDLRDELHEQVQSNIKAGAKCILGGSIPNFSGNHAYYEPTVLSGVKKGMPAYDEEMFGPVASIIIANDVTEAVEIANDTPFGLGAAIFTKNAELAEDIAKNKLQAGLCFVNSMVKSDTRLPFGGINQSGYGRELSTFGLLEFVNIKTVYIS
jgi:succinate-semialdehyde dehydrogenase/glutarate-semialdehyde dehydrogenase